jgi:hypothetical protein
MYQTDAKQANETVQQRKSSRKVDEKAFQVRRGPHEKHVKAGLQHHYKANPSPNVTFESGNRIET